MIGRELEDMARRVLANAIPKGWALDTDDYTGGANPPKFPDMLFSPHNRLRKRGEEWVTRIPIVSSAGA